MPETPEWPSYEIGPKDSIFALGVVSANFVRLESAVYAMFGTILGIDGNLSSRLMFKIGPEMRDRLMREMLPTRVWPKEVQDMAWHFIEGHKVCYENRNKLMHSSVFAHHPYAIVFHKVGRDGKGTIANPLLSELRKVADDMMAFYEFGQQLSNMINFEILGFKPHAGDPWYKSWPGTPPLPSPLEYTSGPVPLRAE